MLTISRAVEKIIEENPFIQESLSKGIINYAALALEMKPRVELETNKEAKEAAIMMALRRLNEKLEKSFVKKINFGDGADVFVKSDLFEVTTKKSKKTFSLVKEIYDIINNESDFLTITEGLTQVTLISNRRNRSKILKILEKEKIIREINNLASLSTIIPSRAIDESGYFYVITRAFALENISIMELVSTLNELSLIVSEKDVPRSFVIFKEVIKRNSS